ncbi:hypothetical protein HPB50_005814 [Hyalomma asiaticum]|uniref:Uncharacterized protein n=1 Tax=Hyalomma asiaticum TaxID=266040 RepID=A0ACB7RM77_HYAAI|nr:hypothetical protein HPB50_005814 [Hyalomma asiaticum]
MPYSLLQDPLLLSVLPWRDIEDLCLLRTMTDFELIDEPLMDSALGNGSTMEQPQWALQFPHGFESMDPTAFFESFRFHRADLGDLVAALRIPAVVASAQKVPVPGPEALCITLRRLASPNRLVDLAAHFGLHISVVSSVVSKVLSHIESHFAHLLADLTVHRWLNPQNLELFSQALHKKGAPLKKCWAFVGDMASQLWQPLPQGQRQRPSCMCQKYQAVICPNGIICQVDGPFQGRRNDTDILNETTLYRNLEKVSKGHKYVIYGGPSYPSRELLIKPYEGTCLEPHEAHFNTCMSEMQQSAERGFGRVAADFSFVRSLRNLPVKDQKTTQMYKVAVLLSNCRTCLYGSEVSAYFDVTPPSLKEYLVPLQEVS